MQHNLYTYNEKELGEDAFETAGLDDVCHWWCEVYPDTVFIGEPKIIIAIRNLMQELLKDEVKKCKKQK